MARAHEEELVLHARLRLGVNDPVDEAVLGIEGFSLDCGRPGGEGNGVEGIWEQARVFCFL